MARIDIKSAGGGGSVATGVLQLENGVAMSSTLTAVTDQNNTTSPLKLSTTAVQVVSPLRITTDDPSDMYLDCEDGSANNRFNITRNSASEQVNLNFASNPTGSTTTVGAIRTYVDGVNLSEVMAFREDGQTFVTGNTTIGNGTTAISSRLAIKGSGSTSATTSLLVQNSGGSEALKVTDDRVVSMIGATTLKISSPSGGVLPVVFSTIGATGGFRGGYDFKSGYNGLEGNTALRIVSPTTTTNFVGIGNLADGDISGGAAKLQIDNTISGGRNAAIKLRVNFADIANQYNGIQFDTIETGAGGAFIGSQRNTPGSGYGSDLVILTTVDASGANAYTENARFIGRYNSFYVGTDKTLAVASAKMQVESTTQGFLPPRMTNAERAAITTPAIGLMVYCTDAVEGIYVYKSTGWTFVA